MSDIHFVIQKAFDLLEIPYTNKYISSFIDKHSSPNSLLCISDIFDKYKLENTAGEFEDKSELHNYPGQHVSQLTDKDGNNYFVLVENWNANNIEYFLLESNDKIIEPLADYFNKWTGIALYFSKTDGSEEPGFAANKKEEGYNRMRISATLVSLTLLLMIYLYKILPTTITIPYLVFIFIVKSMGLLVSYLLISKYYTNDNKLASAFCSIGGNKGGCDQILFSKASKVTRFLSWAEVGLFYYVITTLFWLIGGLGNLSGFYGLVFIVNVFTLPYAFWSIYHQYRVAKNWCVLCLVVQSLLWSEALFHFGYAGVPSFQIEGNILILAFLISTFVISVWYLIKPLLKDSLELQSATLMRSKFIEDKSIFQFLNQSIPETGYPLHDDFIQTGKPQSPIHIGVVTNPKCPSCKTAMKTIFNLYQKNMDRIFLTEIYAVPVEGDNERTLMASHILQYRLENDVSKFKKAIENWYENEGDFDSWSKNFPIRNTPTDRVKEILGYHAFACQKLGVEHTPTIFLNYKKLSSHYSVDDLKVLIDFFEEELEQ